MAIQSTGSLSDSETQERRQMYEGLLTDFADAILDYAGIEYGSEKEVARNALCGAIEQLAMRLADHMKQIPSSKGRVRMTDTEPKTNALAFCPMEDAPQDRPVILRSRWGQVAVAIWDAGVWRYGPKPGETWDADYPDAWVPIHACGWVPANE